MLGSRRPALLVLLALAGALAPVVAADDDVGFRRTTPRAELRVEAGRRLLGVPAGRAWGIESGLRRLPPGASGLRVRLPLAVADPAVREAFVRVAWYARADGRSRQLEVADSSFVVAGAPADAVVSLRPPAGAIAYRIRVLARLGAGVAASAPGAIRIGAPTIARAVPFTRLVPARR